MNTVENFAGLYALTTLADGDMVYVTGFWDKNDGGGGFFIFDKTSTINPKFEGTGHFRVGYNINYDGMVCRADSFPEEGRWIRQWDRGALNLRWFGARPDFSDSRDTSWALNAALEYAQFDPINSFPNGTSVSIFNSTFFTRPGKTIFIPSGRYKFYSAISNITFGIVIEGEGNMGTSAHGTRLYIKQAYSSDVGYSQEESVFLRYVGKFAATNSGAGLKNLSIQVAEETYDTNVISLLSPQEQTDYAIDPTAPGALDYNPGVSKWTAENVYIVMSGLAKRALYMKSSQIGGVLPWRIRDIMLINCWFASASEIGETVRAENVSGLHIVGGFFSSGTGVGGVPLAPGIVLGGIHGCANSHLNGVDLTHAIIKIEKKSLFINIDCRFGKLLVYNDTDKDHEGLHVVKRFILNERTTHPDALLCPVDINNTTATPYKCYNNAHEIECDKDIDWKHNQDCPTV